MIWRNLHPICDTCWELVVGGEQTKTRNLHHFFTFDAHPQCCWCNSPSHGQWWQSPRIEVPCQGLFGFHQTQSVVIDLDEMKKKYRDSDKEVIDLINIARGLQKELDELERKVQTP